MKITAGNIKTGIIIFMAVLLVCTALFGSRAINRYKKGIGVANDSIAVLNTRITLRNKIIVIQETENQKKDVKIDSMKKAFASKEKIIAGITADLNTALAKLNGITSDSSYQWLIKVAYDYPGVMKYLFNEVQLRYIHGDYLIARSAEKSIPEYQKQIQGCKDQFVVRDEIESGLKKIVDLQKSSLSDCQKINDNKDTIIKDTTKALAKAERRKTFWKITTGIASGVAIVFGLAIL